MSRNTRFIIAIVSILALLTGCQVRPAIHMTPSTAPPNRIETASPTQPMPTDLLTATLLPSTVAGLETRLPEQPAGLPLEAEPQPPAACDAPYCLYLADWPLDPPVMPIDPSFIDPTYPFGSTQGGVREVHLGVEFQQAHGSPVLAAAPGSVIVAGDDSLVAYGVRKNVYGHLVVIEHEIAGWDEPVYTLYAHLSDVLVVTGDRVDAGSTIGLVGASGAATGSHLHFEVRTGSNEPGSAVNPLLFLAPPPNSGDAPGRIAGAVVGADGNHVHEIDLVIQALVSESDAPIRNQYLQTYAPGVNASRKWQENFVSGNLPAGPYRLTLVHNGRLYEKVLPVEPGSITYHHIQLGD